MQKISINDGINLYLINDRKFKFFRACVLFHRPLSRQEVTKNSVLASVMRMQSSNYPDSSAIAIALEELYGADLIARSSKYGEHQIIKLGVQTICDEAAGTNNFDNAMKLLYDIVINSGSGSSFDEKIVETEKKNIRDAILAQKNDKRTYSVLRLQEEMCKNEPYGINPLGYIDELEKINAENLYKHYKEVLSESRIDIIFTGNFQNDKAEEAAKHIAQTLDARVPAETVTENRYDVQEIKKVTDKMDVTQGKLCMGFRLFEKSRGVKYAQVVVFNALFGGTATSKLFENVREKLSLCYYVSSSIDRLKEIMIVRSGVEFDNFQTAYDEIMLQLDEIKKCNITDAELDAAKKQIINAYQSNYDSIGAMEEYYTMQLLLKTDVPISEMVNAISSVTKEQAAEAARGVKLDTVYYLDSFGGEK